VQLYGNLQGLDSNGDQLIDPSNGEITTFMNSGDPISNTGWLDFYYSPNPGDVYFMQASGSFDMAPGDTQRVIYAIIIGHDNNRFSSILDLRKNASFVYTSFYNEFSVKATAETEVHIVSEEEIELAVFSAVNSSLGATSMKAELFDYEDNLIQIIDLFDDGQNTDVAAGDNIFTGSWQTTVRDEVLYLNLKLVDETLNEHVFKYADYNITLSDKIEFNSLVVADDNINYDKKINPGENIRINFDFRNNYSFALEKVGVNIATNDPYVQIENRVILFDSLTAGANAAMNYDLNEVNSYLVMNVSPDVPDTHTINFEITILDNQFHEWHKKANLKIEPLDYVPNRIMPTQIAGKSETYFEISVIEPSDLTGHSYLITVADSINESKEKGFNLIDQTLGVNVLENQEAPDQYAYNVPITDGFKIIKALLPEGHLDNVNYDNISGGNPTGFEGVNVGGQCFNGGIVLGRADQEEFFAVEIEFTNTFDSSGVIGDPLGQKSFRYETGSNSAPTGFERCPFNVWRIEKGTKTGMLNACFQENQYFKPADYLWAPDYSDYGGFEVLYIMKSNYDETGQMYMEERVDMNNVLYKIQLKLISENSVVDAGDRLVFDWIYPATSQDKFTFFPTNIKKNQVNVPGEFTLFQNYPNPFNPTTTIKFSIKEQSQVSLKIYNIMGQEIVNLVQENFAPGENTVIWDGRNRVGQLVGSGLFFAKLKSKNRIKIIKMLLIR